VNGYFDYLFGFMFVYLVLIGYLVSGLVRVRVMVFNTTFTGGQCYWRRKQEYPQKTTDLLQVTDTQDKND
jgi:hypothetical protein